MNNSHPNTWFSHASVASPKRLIEVLGRLQTHTDNTLQNQVYIYDLVDQCILCSTTSLVVMLGYAPDEIHEMGRLGVASLIHPEDLNRVSDHYQRFTTLADGEVIEIEYRMRRADGTWCWLRSQETPLVQASDGFPLQVLGMVQNITPLKQEEELREAFAEVINGLSEVVMITDRNGAIVYVNPMFEQVTEYCAIEVIGQTPAILKSGHHEPAFYRKLWSTIYAGQVFQAKFINAKKNGTLFCEEKTIKPIRNQYGQITHFVSIGQVVTESQPDLAISPNFSAELMLN
jgi:PAS domain S-box-containing protein